MRASITKNKPSAILKIGIGTLTVLVVWELIALIVNDSYFFPDVIATGSALARLITSVKFFATVLISLLRVTLGLVLGISSGVVLATITHLIPFAHSIVHPLISVMKATPIATIILILWFAFSDTSLAVFVVFLMVTPIVWQNVYDGYKSISRDMTEVCEVFEFGYLKRLRYLVFPTVMKYLLPAVITSIGLAWKAEIAAEIMTYSNIGKSIQDFNSLHSDTASVFAWAVVTVVISLILEALTKSLLRRIKL